MNETRTLTADEMAEIGRVVELLNEMPEQARELVEAADVLYWAARNEAHGFGSASGRAIESHDRAKAKFGRLLIDARTSAVADALIALRRSAHLLESLAFPHAARAAVVRPAPTEEAKTIDLMDALKQSLAKRAAPTEER